MQIDLQVPLDQLYENLAIITLAAAQIFSWAETNCLRLHAGKTKAIIFGSSHTVKRVKALDLPVISVGSEVIRVSNEVVSLDVVLENTLSWKS